MDAAYAAQYRDLYQRHWWWRAREKLLVRTLAGLDMGSNCAILDVGCGDGLFFPRLARFGVPEGVEADPALVTRRGLAEGRIHVARFDETFQPGRRYDLILMLDVIEHFVDDAACLRRGVELLRPGGRLVATVPAFPLLWTTHDDVNHHFARYTKASFSRLAQRAGLRIDEARYFNHWTFLAKLLVRGKETLLPTAPGPPRIPPRWINGLLYALCRAEAATITRLPVPFGSSLLVVGGRAQRTDSD